MGEYASRRRGAVRLVFASFDLTGAASPSIEILKAEARQLKRAERAEAAQPGASLQMMRNFPNALAQLNPIAGYWPVSTEMDPRPLLAALARAGRAVCLPRMESRVGPARFLSWRADEILKADAFGVLAPPPDSPSLKPQLILVPLLAFDRVGNRLGQGGGHYDRILKAAHDEGAVAVGIAYAAQEMPLVPSEPHDELLDWVVTENEAIRCVGRKLKL